MRAVLPRFMIHARGWTLGICIGAASGPMWAQTAGGGTEGEKKATTENNKERTVFLFHGKDRARLLMVEHQDGKTTSVAPDPWIVKQGTRACLRVVNANPAYYTYSLASVEDKTASTPPSLPIFQPIGALLSRARSGAWTLTAAMEPEPEKVVELEWLATYADQLRAVRNHLQTARDVADQSEEPEPAPAPGMVEISAVGGRGYVWSRDRLRQLLDKESPFKPTLAKMLETWYETAKKRAATAKEAPPEPKEGEVGYEAKKKAYDNYRAWTSVTLEAMKGFGESLLQEWNRIQESFQAPEAWVDCVNVGASPTTLKLSVKRKVKGQALRIEGTDITTVRVTPRYGWQRVSTTAGPILVFTPGAQRFAMKDGVVTSEDDAVRVRGSAALLLHLMSFGEDDEMSAALMGGVAAMDATTTTASQVDGLIGGMVRWRDFLGLGAGIGWANRPKSLRVGAAEGAPLPAGRTLEDVTRKETLFSFYLTLQGTVLSF